MLVLNKLCPEKILLSSTMQKPFFGYKMVKGRALSHEFLFLTQEMLIIIQPWIWMELTQILMECFTAGALDNSGLGSEVASSSKKKECSSIVLHQAVRRREQESI